MQVALQVAAQVALQVNAHVALQVPRRSPCRRQEGVLRCHAALQVPTTCTSEEKDCYPSHISAQKNHHWKNEGAPTYVCPPSHVPNTFGVWELCRRLAGALQMRNYIFVFTPDMRHTKLHGEKLTPVPSMYCGRGSGGERQKRFALVLSMPHI